MIPNLPMTRQIIKENGNIHDAWHQFFDQLITALQKNITPEGNAVPPQSATNIALLNNSKSNNRILINSDTNELLVNLNGVFKTVQTV